MEEYYDVHYSDIHLKKKDDTTLVCNYKKKKYVSFTSPPLLCKSVLQRDNNVSLILETTDNNWNFENTLGKISNQCKKYIIKNSKKWYNIECKRKLETDYISLLEYSRTKTHNENNIVIPIHKKYCKTLTKSMLRGFKNNTIILRFIFYKIILIDEEFIEKWVVDNISLSIPDYEDELSDDFNKDIGEDMFIRNVQYTDDEVSEVSESKEDIGNHKEVSESKEVCKEVSEDIGNHKEVSESKEDGVHKDTNNIDIDRFGDGNNDDIGDNIGNDDVNASNNVNGGNNVNNDDDNIEKDSEEYNEKKENIIEKKKIKKMFRFRKRR
jgi:hypothetical protein